jgi:hypothetical protein
MGSDEESEEGGNQARFTADEEPGTADGLATAKCSYVNPVDGDTATVNGEGAGEVLAAEARATSTDGREDTHLLKQHPTGLETDRAERVVLPEVLS